METTNYINSERFRFYKPLCNTIKAIVIEDKIYRDYRYENLKEYISHEHYIDSIIHRYYYKMSDIKLKNGESIKAEAYTLELIGLRKYIVRSSREMI